MIRLNKSEQSKSPKEIIIKKKVSKKTNGTEQLILCLQDCMTQIQIFHWNTKSYVEHEVLGELYETLIEQVDCLAEQYISCYGPIGVSVGHKKYKTSDDLLEGLKHLVEVTECEKRGINATIDNIHTALLKACYKLKLRS